MIFLWFMILETILYSAQRENKTVSQINCYKISTIWITDSYFQSNLTQFNTKCTSVVIIETA